MCRIAGGVGDGRLASQAVKAMVGAQRRRGPDADGFYADPAGLAAVGHNRLSIIDLSPAGRQPMASADSRYWIVLNCEIYNYRELRAELTDYPFRTWTDTEKRFPRLNAPKLLLDVYKGNQFVNGRPVTQGKSTTNVEAVA